MDNVDGYNEFVLSVTSGAYTGVLVVFYLLWAVAMWKVFSKAGYAGILALIPIVNLIILVKIAGYSAWLFLLYLIPVVGWIFAIFVAFRLGANYGKGGFFSFLWLWLFPVIGYFIIGFGSARYQELSTR